MVAARNSRVGRAVEPRADVLDILFDVPEREGHCPIYGAAPSRLLRLLRASVDGAWAAGQWALRQNRLIASYAVNKDAVTHAKQLIDARQYVLRSRWQDVQPRAREQNAFLKTHSFEDYAVWHLGPTESRDDEMKARYAFVYGDFRRLHRMGLIACHYRAAEWRHKEIEPAAHELLQYLDEKTAR